MVLFALNEIRIIENSKFFYLHFALCLNFYFGIFDRKGPQSFSNDNPAYDYGFLCYNCVGLV